MNATFTGKSSRYDFIANCISNDTGDGVNAKFQHDARSMSFHSFDADTQGGADLLVASPLGKQLDHFPFSRSQPTERNAAVRGLLQRRTIARHRTGDLGRKVLLVLT